MSTLLNNPPAFRVFIGYDPREALGYHVTAHSLKKKTRYPVLISPLVLEDLQSRGLYSRPTERDEQGRLFDVISGAPMATEFAVSRFLAYHVSKSWANTTRINGQDCWVLFVDCDMLFRQDVDKLTHLIQKKYADKAVVCVKHDFRPTNAVKMDNQLQTLYARKNWSSVMAINMHHPKNAALTLEYVNSVPGRDLHAFSWLDDGDIGALDPAWNYLVGHYSKDDVPNPHIVHFTDGLPFMPGYENTEYADEWRKEMRNMAYAV